MIVTPIESQSSTKNTQYFHLPIKAGRSGAPRVSESLRVPGSPLLYNLKQKEL